MTVNNSISLKEREIERSDRELQRIVFVERNNKLVVAGRFPECRGGIKQVIIKYSQNNTRARVGPNFLLARCLR